MAKILKKYVQKTTKGKKIYGSKYTGCQLPQSEAFETFLQLISHALDTERLGLAEKEENNPGDKAIEALSLEIHECDRY